MAKQQEILRKKVLHIVEKMLENPVSEEWLVTSCQFITQDDYNDIVNERSIIKLCGYPLCLNTLSKVPQQKYHICRKTNKVYDITERKNFCSGNCYKASNYLKTKILTNPMWMREDEELPQISILPAVDKSGISGEEIEMNNRITKLESESVPPQISQIKILPKKPLQQIGSPYIENEDIERCASHFHNLKINEKNVDIICEIDSLSNDSDDDEIPNALVDDDRNIKLDTLKAKPLKENILSAESKDIEQLSSRLKDLQVAEKFPGNSHGVQSRSSVQIQKSTDLNCFDNEDHNKKIKYIPQEIIMKRNGTSEEIGYSDHGSLSIMHKEQISAAEKHPQENILHLVEEILKHWITVKTLIFLFGMEKFMDLYQIKDSFLKNIETNHNMTKAEKIKQEYFLICQKLNSEEIIDSRNDSILLSHQSSSVSRIGKSQGNQTKFKGRKKSASKRSGILSTATTEGSEDSQVLPILPRIDTISQNSIRRKIVLDKLCIVYSDILPTIGLELSNLSASLQELIATFRLTASTVTFRPSEWKFLALFLLHMLRLKSQVIEESLRKPKSMEILNSYLQVFDSSGQDFDNFLSFISYENSFL